MWTAVVVRGGLPVVFHSVSSFETAAEACAGVTNITARYQSASYAYEWERESATKYIAILS